MSCSGPMFNHNHNFYYLLLYALLRFSHRDMALKSEIIMIQDKAWPDLASKNAYVIVI